MATRRRACSCMRSAAGSGQEQPHADAKTITQIINEFMSETGLQIRSEGPPRGRKESVMSTNFVLSRKLNARTLFSGRLEDSGILEHVTPNTNERQRCLTDGRNYLWVYMSPDGQVSCLSRYALNASGKILSAIAEAFDVQIWSE